ncbi:FmdB family zinc ribbon protein [Desulforhopalus singaporensis]|uniref:FmdB family zinc ribbon protein n=1 Tax=Desulforhopalus singaporensis TaxID=91360 RepID=UPI000B862BEF
MPIFEYRCNKCENVFELLQLSSSQQDKKPTCNKCGSEDVSKLISAGVVRAGGEGSAPSLPSSRGCGASGFS